MCWHKIGALLICYILAGKTWVLKDIYSAVGDVIAQTVTFEGMSIRFCDIWYPMVCRRDFQTRSWIIGPTGGVVFPSYKSCNSPLDGFWLLYCISLICTYSLKKRMVSDDVKSIFNALGLGMFLILRFSTIHTFITRNNIYVIIISRMCAYFIKK